MRALQLMCIGLLVATAVACAETDNGKSYLLRHAPVTLTQAAQIAESHGPGRAVRVELDQSSNRVFYDIDIVDTVNKTKRLRVDAETGKIVKGGGQ